MRGNTKEEVMPLLERMNRSLNQKSPKMTKSAYIIGTGLAGLAAACLFCPRWPVKASRGFTCSRV